MSFPRFAVVGALSLSAGVWAACGGTVATQSNGNTTGSGGGTTTTASDTTTTTTTTNPVDAGPDADDGMPSTTYPAPFPAPPQVVTLGGPVLQNPRFVPVFFASDDPTYVTALTDFDNKIGVSKYWATAVSEYNVGPGMATAPVMLTETAPASIDDTGIQTWLQGKLNGDDPAWPASDANTVYVLHYPASTTITLQNATSCTQFGGYHSNTSSRPSPTAGRYGGAAVGADVSYAVIPRCTDFPPLMGIDAVTGAESHELAESVTDPYPEDKPAYATVDNGHFFWERALGGGEVGDMCAQFPDVWNKWPDLSYTVQSIWSNANATAGHNPCQPAASTLLRRGARPQGHRDLDLRRHEPGPELRQDRGRRHGQRRHRPLQRRRHQRPVHGRREGLPGSDRRHRAAQHHPRQHHRRERADAPRQRAGDDGREAQHRELPRDRQAERSGEPLGGPDLQLSCN